MKKLLGLLLFTLPAFGQSLLPSVSIYNLPSSTQVYGTDYTIDDQSSANGSCPSPQLHCTNKATFSQVLSYIEANYNGPTGVVYFSSPNNSLTITGSGTGTLTAIVNPSAAGVPTQTGTIVPGDCVTWATMLSVKDSGAPCTGGGGGNMNTSGSPLQYQVGLWTGSTTMTGLTAGTAGQVLTANGTSAYPLWSSTLGSVTSVRGSTIPLSAGTLWGSNGSFTVGDCVQVSTTGTSAALSDTGAPCGSGGSGGGNVSAVSSPTQYQIPAWASPTTILGIGPGVSGQALISNGSGGYPSYSSSLADVTSVHGTAIPSSSQLPTYTGTPVATHCVEWQSAGVLEDAGSTCGSGGGGSGTVNSGTSGQLAYYATSGTAVSGETTVSAGQFPALTGAITSAGGTLATSFTAIAATTLIANSGGSSAAPASTPIGGNLAFSGGALVTSQAVAPKTGSYTVVTGDAGNLLTFNSSSAVTVTIPQAGSTGFAAGFSIDVENLNAGTVNLTPTTSTVNGLSTLAIVENTGCTITSDGTNYQVSACTALTIKSYTVATLPACSSTQNTYNILVATDTASPAYNATLTGGGSTPIPVFCNGTNWTAH